MVRQLLPCPFCGREPKVIERKAGASETGREDKFAAFIACHCGGYSARAHQPGFGFDPAEALRIAATAWNTRHEAQART